MLAHLEDVGEGKLRENSEENRSQGYGMTYFVHKLATKAKTWGRGNVLIHSICPTI